MIDLKQVAKEINEILDNRRRELQLTFEEDTHTYTMLDNDGVLRSDWKSVSTIVKKFYEPFDAESKSYEKAKGDLEEQQRLLAEWAYKGSIATNQGSRAHYELEKYVVGLHNDYKEVRKPIFECNEEQILNSDNMIKAGKKFVNVMLNERNSVLLDTELVSGMNSINGENIGYVGQGDNYYLVLNKDKTEPLLLVTDYKTNDPKNFEPQWYTKKMYPPFDDYDSTDLQHYYLQLPLYSRLLIDMLKGSKYENLKLGGCIIVLLKKDATYVEYRVPKLFNDVLMNIDLSRYLYV